MTPLLALLMGYLIGGVPFGYLAGRLALGVDIRTLGSGNPGASNVFRQAGASWGVAVLLLDAGKGLLAVLLAGLLLGPGRDGWVLGTGVAAILGHSFTPYLSLRGGKGVATSAGVFLGLAPGATSVALVVFLLAMLLGRMISLSSLGAALALPVALWFMEPENRLIFCASLFVAALVWYRHRSNIGRILKGEEPRFTLRRKEG